MGMELAGAHTPNKGYEKKSKIMMGSDCTEIKFEIGGCEVIVKRLNGNKNPTTLEITAEVLS